MQIFHRFKKIIIYSVTILMVVPLFMFSLLRPPIVYANLSDTIANAAQQVIGGSSTGVGFPTVIMEDISKIKWQSIYAGLLGSLVHAGSYMMRKLAYDSASYLASAASGQKPLAFQEPADKYFETLALDTAADAISEIGKPFGLNLCKPPDLRFQINLQVSLDGIYKNEAGDGPKPDCSWQQLQADWDNIDQMYSGDALEERFSAKLSVTQGDFGVALSSLQQIDNRILKQQEANMLDRLIGQGFKPVKENISGAIRTPSQLVKEEAKALTSKEQGNQSLQQITGLYAADAWQIIPTALSVFTNTFLSQFLSNILKDGLLPSPSGDGTNAITDQFAQTLSNNRQVAQAIYAYFLTGQAIRDEGTYDTVSRFASCPDRANLDNCVIDNDFVRALEQARSSDPITIAEAIEKNLLHGNWQLIPPTRTDLNESTNCRLQAYCYSNIQKLRRMRILPLGFEIAALKSDVDNPVTLAEVVHGFNACGNAENLIPNDAFPYCHLIDPNWLLTAPVARHEQKVYGPQLVDQSFPQREEEFVDVKTCLRTDDHGRCLSYGYCNQEQNVWRLSADACPSYYATCQTFTGKSGLIDSYLTRTLDYGMCTAESVGCQTYSLEKNADGTWKNSATINIDNKINNGRNQIMYFNETLAQYSCPATENGCNIFRYDADSGEQLDVFLKKAPDYLGCYDIDNATSGIQWPETQSQLALLEDRPEQCRDFAGVCIADEVGCESYTPRDGSEALTAVVGDNNRCDSACVGYETFRQRQTAFESSKFPLYFIPQNAQQCSIQDVGCDQFVDLSEGSGEIFNYFTDITACRQPIGDNGRVYYTWEGSENEGYILKKFDLLQTTSVDAEKYTDGDYFDSNGVDIYSVLLSEIEPIGSPRYDDDSYQALADNYALCNENAYNILLENPYADGAANTDCRKFYDDQGNEYYRLLENVVLIDTACTRYRKSIPETAQVAGKTVCSNGGVFNATNNTCEYWNLPTEKYSCSAEVNGCRTYVGNTGQNIFEFYNNSFEPSDDTVDALNEAKAGWSGSNISVEPEATQVGLHSLKVSSNSSNASASYDFAPGTFKPGANYEVSLWVRSEQSAGMEIYLQQNNTPVTVFTNDSVLGNAKPVPMTTQWQSVRMPPLPFDGQSNATTTLVFKINNITNVTFYIDNIRVTSAGGSDLDDYVYVVKDTWKTESGYDVPLVCDDKPLDQYPGDALGCREYTRRDESVVSLTGFQNLCRAEAVGCMPLTDTYNRLGVADAQVSGLENTTSTAVYNVYCERKNPSNENLICNVVIGDVQASCEILKDQTGCYLEGAFSTADTATYDTSKFTLGAPFGSSGVNMSTTYIAPITTTTIYLTQYNLPQSQSYLCNRQYVGCQEVAQEIKELPTTTTQAYSFSEAYYTVNNPEHYKETLCVQEQVGCERFASKQGASYFKDPKNSTSPFCNYKQGVGQEGQVYDGWFLDDVGLCSNSDDYCKKDSDCGATATCTNIGEQACYPGYVLPGPTYGVWSNASKDYAGRVAKCDAQYASCSEFVDPAGVSGAVEGHSYFVLDNEKLHSGKDVCNGKVSQKEGCVLFDNVNNPTKLYSSEATYTTSELQQYALVTPENDVNGDANTILKVGQDRECREWLACRSSVTVTTEDKKRVTLCQEYDACNQLNTDGTCGNWVNYTTDITRLTEEKYINRGISWSDPEYSGYSLFNKYNPAEYVYIFTDNDDAAYMAYRVPDNIFLGSNADEQAEFETYSCFEKDASGYTKNDGDRCGVDDGGRCYNQKCLYPVNGEFSNIPLNITNPVTQTEDIKKNIETMISGLDRASCKNFPEKGSPYPYFTVSKEGIVDVIYGKASNSQPGTNGPYRREYKSVFGSYGQVNVCQVFNTGDEAEDNQQNCSCDYIKVEYRDGTIDFWPQNVKGSNNDITAVIPSGVCSGTGEKAGNVCSSDSDCWMTESAESKEISIPGSGSCSLKRSESYHYGLKGLCLEYDRSRPLGIIRDESRLADSFACLTWLPIEVSASKIDIYNADQEAGYDLTIDAKNPADIAGGQLYCLEGEQKDKYFDDNVNLTDFLPYSYEAQYLGQGFLPAQILATDDINSVYFGGVDDNSGAYFFENYNKSYNSDPKPNSFKDRDLSGNLYSGVYHNMKAYSSAGIWTDIDTNLLPQEAISDTEEGVEWIAGYGIFKHTHSIKKTKYEISLKCDDTSSSIRQTDDNDSGDNTKLQPSGYVVDACKQSGREMYGGITKWAWDNMGSNAVVLRIEGGETNYMDGKFGNVDNNSNGSNVAINAFVPSLSNGNCIDTGVVQHGPRFGEKILTQEYTNGVKKESCPHSYDTSYFSLPASSGKAYISNLEKTLNKADLQKVCFVPLMITDGIDYYYQEDYDNKNDGIKLADYVPSLLEKEICIDFGKKDEEGAISNSEKTLKTIPYGSIYFSGNLLDVDGGGHQNAVYANSDGVNFPLNRTTVGDMINKTNQLYVWQFTQKDSELEDFYKVQEYTDERDKIAYRQVLMVYDEATRNNLSIVPGDKLPGIGVNLGKPGENGLLDPFSHQTILGQQQNPENSWFVIGMDFNKDGDFLGYVTRAYKSYAIPGGTNPGQMRHGIKMAVVAQMYNKCVDIAQVYNKSENPITGTTNKAWTNRVWDKNNENIITDPFSIGAITQNKRNPPFGSLPFYSDDIGKNEILRQNRFADGDVDGVPYWCNTKGVGDGTFNCKNLQIKDGTVNYSNDLLDYLLGKTKDDALSAVKSIFSVSFKGKKQNTNGDFVDEPDSSWDVSNNLSNTTPPRIYAINPVKCGAGVGSGCSAGQENAFTVNGRNYIIADYDGDGIDDEDSNQNGRIDPLIADASLSATVKFFAYADDNHMPIRRVMVDWQDDTDSTNQNIKGLYKNRKPFCGGDDGGATRCTKTDSQITCTEDDDCRLAVGEDSECKIEGNNFGDADRACREDYFEFFHMYYCSDATANTTLETLRGDTTNTWFSSQLDAEEAYNRLLERGLKDDSKVCIFRPRVQVLDNWGWCNGSCDENSPNGLGCYNSQLTTLQECELKTNLSSPAYTLYRGSVILIP